MNDSQNGVELNSALSYSRRIASEPLTSSYQHPAPSKYQYSNRQPPQKLEIALTSMKSATSFFLIDSKMHSTQGKNAQF